MSNNSKIDSNINCLPSVPGFTEVEEKSCLDPDDSDENSNSIDSIILQLSPINDEHLNIEGRDTYWKNLHVDNGGMFCMYLINNNGYKL